MKKGKYNHHELEDRINAHAWKSPQWKKKLLANPKTAISELTGESFPGEMSLKVIEEGKKECVIVLHPLPSNATDMSEEELRKVAGGIKYAQDDISADFFRNPNNAGQTCPNS